MNIEKTKSFLKKIFDIDQTSNIHLTPMIWGGAGVGKSQIVSQVSKEIDYLLRDIRLSTLSPVDVRGIPFVETETSYKEANQKLSSLINDLELGKIDSTTFLTQSKNIQNQHLNSLQRFRFIPPDFMPTGKEEKPVMLFFDEVNTAVPANQVVAYEIALDRRMGGHPLPDKTLVVMAGNRVQDRGATYEMPMPLANRLIHIDLIPHIDEWIYHGLANNFHEAALSFLKMRPELLNVRPDSNKYAFPTPRTWEMVSTFLKTNSDKEEISCIIGEGNATELFNFLKLKDRLPDLDEVLAKGSNFNDEDHGVMYFYIVSLSSRLIKKVRETKNSADREIYMNKFIDSINKTNRPEFQGLAINCVQKQPEVIIHFGKNRKFFNAIQAQLK